MKLAAQKSRMATIYADRTRLVGDYHLGYRAGTFGLDGDYAADSAKLDPSMLAGVTQPLEAAAKTPLGPVAGAIGNAILRTAANFNAAGKIRVVNFPGGGAARIETADIIGPGGARARVFGASGVTYYWPSGGLRIDGDIEMAGGGLPSGPGEPAPGRGPAIRCAAWPNSRPTPPPAHGSRSPRSVLGRDPADRPRSARSPNSTGRSPAAGSRRCESRSPAGSAAAAASLSAPRARW